MFDRDREPSEWADNLSRKADTRRNLAELQADAAGLARYLDEQEEALKVAATGKFPDIVNDIRKRASWISAASGRVGDKLPPADMIALLRRGAAILADRPGSGALAMVDAELGRRIYIEAGKTDDLAMMREAVDAYRRALVPDAKLPEFDNWRTTQSNLGLALVEIARISKDKSGLPDAAIALGEAIASARTPAEVVVDRKRLAETWDQLSAEGDPVYLRKAADAWGDLAENYPGATDGDRAFAWESRAVALQNLAYYAPGQAATATAEAIAAYRQALPLYSDPAHAANRQGVSRYLASLLRSAGENGRDEKMLQEAADLYAGLDAPARKTDDPERPNDRLGQAGTLVSLGRLKQDAALFDRAIAIFKAELGDAAAKPPADWHTAMSYAAALRERGYLGQDAGLIRQSSAILVAARTRPAAPLTPLDVASLRIEEAEADLYLGDMTGDAAAVARAVAAYRDTAGIPEVAASPPYVRYLTGRIATGSLLTGELTGDGTAYKDGVAQTRQLMRDTSRTADPAGWSQLATDAAFGISRALRAGDVSLGTIDEAASLARDAVGYFTQNPGDGLPYAKDALCNVLIEQGRLARARATVEEGIGLCREAIAALSDKGRPHALVRIGKTVAYGEGVLAKL